MKRADGKYAGIYCHFDGYLSHNGEILKESYTDPKKVKKLIALGDLSALGPNIDPPKGMKHSYAKPVEGVVIAYHRDRGEDFNMAMGATVEDVAGEIDNGGNVYVFEDGKWTYNGKNY
jgi:hypothetical protein